MPIKFHYADVVAISLPKKTDVKKWIGSIFEAEKKQLNQLDYIFCSDEYLLAINREFLQHDYYTDIITFDLSEGKRSLTTGEIYIS